VKSVKNTSLVRLITGCSSLCLMYTDPKDVYRRPLVSSHEIGNWTRDEPIREKEPWTYTQRRVLVNSEMTRSTFTDLLQTYKTLPINITWQRLVSIKLGVY